MKYTFNPDDAEKFGFERFDIRIQFMKQDYPESTPLVIFTSDKATLFEVLNDMNNQYRNAKYWFVGNS